MLRGMSLLNSGLSLTYNITAALKGLLQANYPEFCFNSEGWGEAGCGGYKISCRGSDTHERLFSCWGQCKKTAFCSMDHYTSVELWNISWNSLLKIFFQKIIFAQPTWINSKHMNMTMCGIEKNGYLGTHTIP